MNLLEYATPPHPIYYPTWEDELLALKMPIR